MPIESPSHLFFDGWDSKHCAEEVVLFFGIRCNCVQEEDQMHLHMCVFHGDLNPAEGACLGDSDFTRKVLEEVFVCNRVGGGKEREGAFDEVLLLSREGQLL